MTLQDLLAKVYQDPKALVFADVLATIETEFEYTPAAFTNGTLQNGPTENQSSCKVFAFAHQAGLSETHTLALFAEHYQTVLNEPDGISHQNIRSFMENGWKGISFQHTPLKKK